MSLAQQYAACAATAVAGLGSRPRVGTDVQAVEPVLESLRGPLRQRYLARVFTPRELDDSGVGSTTDLLRVAESLAARFAAKEAVLKVLRPTVGAPRPPWTAIEICREPSGAVRLELHGAAARQATEAGLTAWTCSLSHDGGVAVATVVAVESATPAVASTTPVAVSATPVALPSVHVLLPPPS